MKIVVLGAPDDARGATLAGARGAEADRAALASALADPEVGLIFVSAKLEPPDDDRVVLLPEGGSDATARQRGRGRSGGA